MALTLYKLYLWILNYININYIINEFINLCELNEFKKLKIIINLNLIHFTNTEQFIFACSYCINFNIIKYLLTRRHLINIHSYNDGGFCTAFYKHDTRMLIYILSHGSYSITFKSHIFL